MDERDKEKAACNPFVSGFLCKSLLLLQYINYLNTPRPPSKRNLDRVWLITSTVEKAGDWKNEKRSIK
jgi:hypothetical protein